MSTLTDNLQTIYLVKQQLKQAIGTSSDIFEDYPSYVANMVTPTGYTYVTANGDYNVSSYQMVNVNVAGSAAPSAYIYVYKDWDDVNEEFGSYAKVAQNEYGNYTYTIGTVPNGEQMKIGLRLEFDNTAFPMNGWISWQGIEITDENVSEQGATQPVQFIVGEGEEAWGEGNPFITNSISDYDLTGVTIAVQPDGENPENMQVFVGWLDPTGE